MRKYLAVIVVAMLSVVVVQGQSTNASVAGYVTDPTKAVISDAKVIVINTATNQRTETTTDNSGSYSLGSLPPGPYRIEVEKPGFKTVVKSDVILHVQDAVAINFEMSVGSASEVITVQGGAPLVNTESAAVSTIVDQNFVDKIPLNGRSFQTLLLLTPGVTPTVSSSYDSGQFSINGQRASSNYWTVDGVSANIGISPYASPGNGFSGTLGSFSALGGTNSLVSVDAMQEFRIQTSTYAPEFGRAPGGQISILTRSGGNQFHGSVFEYLRNDALDSNNWFNGYTNNPPLPKAKERQNDFGGTLSGPIIKDRTFFFFSYEGFRLRLPETALTTVPSATARQNAIPAVQPYLNAYPLPNGADLGNGTAEFNASFSDSASLNAYSIRVDHRVNNKLTLFGRYDNSPSDLIQRGSGGSLALSDLFASTINTQTATVGASWGVSPAMTDELRFNYSKTTGASRIYLDNFGGAVPVTDAPFPSPFTAADGDFAVSIFSLLSGGQLNFGKNARNVQQQVNVIDTLAIQRGTHSLKFGVDYRRLAPVIDPIAYNQQVYFLDMPSAQVGNSFLSAVGAHTGTTLVFHSVGAFAQDTWRLTQRFTLTYGLRWDIDVAPSAASGPDLLAVTGFDLNDLSHLALAPAGNPPFRTTYGNFAPRVGAAYQISQRANWDTVLRGGVGIFYDLPSSEAGSLVSLAGYPFGSLKLNIGGTFPLDAASAAPPPITPSFLSSAFGTLGAFDPHLQLPYALEWNVALEQGLGSQQAFTASYVGSSGRRLIQSAFVVAPNANLGNAYLVGNLATSSYNALQLQFQRRLSNGLQALAGYTWSHSIDTASAGSVLGNRANAATPGLDPNTNRGPSDFDVRHSFSAGLTYSLAAPRLNSLADAFLRGWSLDGLFIARTAPPVNINDVSFSTLFGGYAAVRPDVVGGVPFYVHGAQCESVFLSPCPGGTGFNPAAFTHPPVDPSTGLPARQGNLARNALRGFGAWQLDFAVHREFTVHERVKLQFRAELFNLFNHPNFGQPNSGFGSAGFGLSTKMLGQSLSGNNVGGGSLSPLYQIGGPRSVQLALKLTF